MHLSRVCTQGRMGFRAGAAAAGAAILLVAAVQHQGLGGISLLENAATGSHAALSSAERRVRGQLLGASSTMGGKPVAVALDGGDKEDDGVGGLSLAKTELEIARSNLKLDRLVKARDLDYQEFAEASKGDGYAKALEAKTKLEAEVKADTVKAKGLEKAARQLSEGVIKDLNNEGGTISDRAMAWLTTQQARKDSQKSTHDVEEAHKAWIVAERDQAKLKALERDAVFQKHQDSLSMAEVALSENARKIEAVKAELAAAEKRTGGAAAADATVAAAVAPSAAAAQTAARGVHEAADAARDGSHHLGAEQSSKKAKAEASSAGGAVGEKKEDKKAVKDVVVAGPGMEKEVVTPAVAMAMAKAAAAKEKKGRGGESGPSSVDNAGGRRGAAHTEGSRSSEAAARKGKGEGKHAPDGGGWSFESVVRDIDDYAFKAPSTASLSPLKRAAEGGRGARMSELASGGAMVRHARGRDDKSTKIAGLMYDGGMHYQGGSLHENGAYPAVAVKQQQLQQQQQHAKKESKSSLIPAFEREPIWNW